MWLPIYVPSDVISLNQNDIDNIKLNNANIKKYDAIIKPWIDNTIDVVTDNKEILVLMGHGEGDTKWKGWAWKLLIVNLLPMAVKYK